MTVTADSYICYNIHYLLIYNNINNNKTIIIYSADSDLPVGSNILSRCCP